MVIQRSQRVTPTSPPDQTPPISKSKLNKTKSMINMIPNVWNNGANEGVLIWNDGKWDIPGEYPLIYFIDKKKVVERKKRVERVGSLGSGVEWCGEGGGGKSGMERMGSLGSGKDIYEGKGDGKGRKAGKTVLKGHKNYELMLNLQLTVRYSVGKPSSVLSNLRLADFDSREKFWTKFPSEGSKFTPPHHSVGFKGKDYCPMVFRHLRELSGIDPADYMLAICGGDALRELSSPGKSGSVFYITQDDRFMIKTATKCEMKVLIKMLQSYYKHVSSNKNTLITKFFGAHCVKSLGGQKVRFIIMGNLFSSESRIHRRFDLKGSSHGRMTNKLEEEITETTTLKDLDLNFRFRLERSQLHDLNRQIDRDCEFLEGENIMDYSLLVGLHFRNDSSDSKMGLLPSVVPSGKKHLRQDKDVVHGLCFSELKLQDVSHIDAQQKSPSKLGANMPVRAEEMVKRFNIPSQRNEIYEANLFFGIIDILQDYDITKKLEHAYKSLHADPSSISAVSPKLYSKRFCDFLDKIFVEDK